MVIGLFPPVRFRYRPLCESDTIIRVLPLCRWRKKDQGYNFVSWAFRALMFAWYTVSSEARNFVRFCCGLLITVEQYRCNRVSIIDSEPARSNCRLELILTPRSAAFLPAPA